MSICAVADRADHDTFDLGADWLKARLETVPPTSARRWRRCGSAT